METGKSVLTVEEEKAIRQVRDIKAFYAHLLAYVVCMPVIVVINMVTTPEHIWFVYTAIGWGLGVLSHGVAVFELFSLFSADWEKRQIEKRLGRKLERGVIKLRRGAPDGKVGEPAEAGPPSVLAAYRGEGSGQKLFSADAPTPHRRGHDSRATEKAASDCAPVSVSRGNDGPRQTLAGPIHAPHRASGNDNNGSTPRSLKICGLRAKVAFA